MNLNTSFILFFVLLVFPAQLNAQQSEKQRLQQDLTQKQDQAKEQKQSLDELSSKERKLYSELAKIEERVSKLENKLQNQEQQLEAKEQKKEKLLNGYQKLKKEHKIVQEDLRYLLKQLWPLHIRSQDLGLSNLKNWAEADRQFTWLACIYNNVENKAEILEDKSNQLHDNLEKQSQVSKQISRQIEKIQNSKDELLQDKLNYLHRMQKLRARRLEKEEQLQVIQKTIKDLKYKMKLLSTRKFAQLKGHLPWPVKGDIVASFNLGANPPQRGLGLEVSSQQDIQAISWGKVVHNDQMRGLGHVVILFHGQDYYSLYAYLANSYVQTGQDVEKGEILGQAGFYPPAEGPGLYFELRFRQKAINPEVWLRG